MKRGTRPRGWLQREADGRFVGLTASGNVLPGYGLRLGGAVDAFLELEPEWVLHNAAYKPAAVLGAVTDVGPSIREAVREVVADPDSGGSRWLELRKIDHWNNRLHDWGLADAALTALGYPDKTERTSRALAEKSLPTGARRVARPRGELRSAQGGPADAQSRNPRLHARPEAKDHPSRSPGHAGCGPRG